MIKIRGLNPDLINAAASVLLVESTIQPEDEFVSGRVKAAVDSGRYDIIHSERSSYDPARTKEFHLLPKLGDGWVNVVERKGRPGLLHYDPRVSHPVSNGDTDFPRNYIDLKPGFHKSIPATREHGVIFRGMSQEEYDDSMARGFFKSAGAMNLEGQEGLTYYSKSPEQAAFYAHSFAPAQYKATGQHHAYVVAVKDPGTDVRLPGVGEDEVGIPHEIPVSDMVGLYVGKAYAATHGNFQTHKSWDGKITDGSSNDPTVHVRWEKQQ